MKEQKCEPCKAFKKPVKTGVMLLSHYFVLNGKIILYSLQSFDLQCLNGCLKRGYDRVFRKRKILYEKRNELDSLTLIGCILRIRELLYK